MFKKFLFWSPGIKFFRPLDFLGFSVFFAFFWDKFIKLISLRTKFKSKIKHQNLDIYAKKIKQNGFIKIENFMENNDFIFLKKFLLAKDKELGDNKIDNYFTIKTLRKNIFNIDILEKYFDKNSMIHCLVEKLTKINSSLSAPIEFRSFKNFEEKMMLNYDDGSEITHRDVFYDSFKAILYLEDTDENNGAFTYVDKSSNYNINDFFQNFFFSFIGNNAFKFFNNKKKTPISLNGTANTLIIMNARGLHRRGFFLKKGIRSTLFVDYRYLHSPINIADNLGLKIN